MERWVIELVTLLLIWATITFSLNAFDKRRRSEGSQQDNPLRTLSFSMTCSKVEKYGSNWRIKVEVEDDAVYEHDYPHAPALGSGSTMDLLVSDGDLKVFEPGQQYRIAFLPQ